MASPIQLAVRSTDYLTGLRGLAALIVYTYHLALPFTPAVNAPFHSISTSSLLQLPILRIFFSGFQMVGLFFALSGFVLSTKPARLARTGDLASFTTSLSSSIFRRAWRLYLPVLPSTFFVMLAAYSGLLYKGLNDEEIAESIPITQGNLLKQTWDWLCFVYWSLMHLMSLRPFTVPSNYGTHLYTIPWEMRDSMILYICAAGLLTLCDWAFYASAVGLIAYFYSFYMWDTALFVGGLTIARYTESKTFFRVRNKSRTNAVAFGIMVVGLYFTSLPVEQDGYFGLVGSKLTMVWGNLLLLGSIIHLTSVQRLLSFKPIQFLGDISFSLYIIHEPTLRLFGWRMVAWFTNLTHGSLAVGLVASWVILTPFLMALAFIYWQYIDLPSIRFAKWLESKLRLSSEDSYKPIPLRMPEV
ncbi:acyltransferase 3 [Xylogone sp. PMI_703]|nr:acyltransferase 3 [Xylogone sp. PMI_703]